jgi:hypothetical protein
VSDQAQTPDPVTAELAKYSQDLVPGAVEELSSIWGQSLGKLPADKLAATVRERMDTPFVGRYRNPEAPAPTLPDGGTPSELRRALERNASRLAPGAVDALMTRLGHEVAGRKPAEIAGHVERFLHGNAAHDFLAVRPEVPAHEARIRDLLNANFQLPAAEVEKLARNRQFVGLSDQAVVSMMARTLRIDPTDPRRTGRAADPFGTRPAPTPAAPKAQARDESSGQFTKGDEPPPRRSLVR